MRSTDRTVDQIVTLRGLPLRSPLTAEELDAAVAAQLQQRAEQGFRDVRPRVLRRVAEIVARVPWEMAA